MTSSVRSAATPADAELVLLSRSGHHDAFATIVSRYQGLVCSVTYSSMGNLQRSEELAHETFVTAWKRLGELEEPSKLRSWLCGIARYLSFNARRGDRRNPAADASAIDPASESDFAAGAVQPAEAAISSEEEAILWKSLEQIPETYREPLILYYRQGHSTAAVAEALGLTEETVRQRLVRGRKLLHEQVTAFVEGALERSAPGPAFTAGVIGAIPPLVVGAKLGALSTGAKASSSIATTAALGAWVGAMSGALVGAFGAYVGYRIGIAHAQSDEERAEISAFFQRISWGVVGFLVLFFAIAFGWRYTGWSTRVFVVAIIALSVGYTVVCMAGSVAHSRRLKALREGRSAIAGGDRSRSAGRSLRSAKSWLGLPYLHVEWGTGRDARGWIAMSDQKAYGGLMALGGVAIAPISMGGVAIGMLAVGGATVGLYAAGGLCLGVVTTGGMGAGLWAIAGCAVGLYAAGGFAAGWSGAAGGLAISHQFAVGGKAIAPHANDAMARAALEPHSFFAMGHFFGDHPAAVGLLPILPLLLWSGVTLKVSRNLQRSA